MKERNKKILNFLQEQKSLLEILLAAGSSLGNLLVDMETNLKKLYDLITELIKENETSSESDYPAYPKYYSTNVLLGPY